MTDEELFDGLMAANRLFAACERGDIDQHAAPDIGAARDEIIKLRAEVAQLTTERDFAHADAVRWHNAAEQKRNEVVQYIAERDAARARVAVLRDALQDLHDDWQGKENGSLLAARSALAAQEGGQP